jgi:hypothetical protein
LPLSKRARIEVYLPIKNKAVYKRLRRTFEAEFLQTFGGCTIIRGAKGLYLSSSGEQDTDEIDLIYSDTPFDFDANVEAIGKYTDELRQFVLEATTEESVLIVVHELYHSI